ncbi:hypothetical protein CsSME_00010606 [Camellia sinensis var. sinensis]
MHIYEPSAMHPGPWHDTYLVSFSASVSTSPLPYSTMASQCEALGTGARKKLSNWLTQESHYTKTSEKVLPEHTSMVRRRLENVTRCVTFLTCCSKGCLSWLDFGPAYHGDPKSSNQ